jgi:hypothetical protein
MEPLARKCIHVTRRRSLVVNTNVTRREMLHTVRVRRDSISLLIRRTAPRCTFATRRRKEVVHNIATRTLTNTSVAVTRDSYSQRMERNVSNHRTVHVKRRTEVVVSYVTPTRSWEHIHVDVPRRDSNWLKIRRLVWIRV